MTFPVEVDSSTYSNPFDADDIEVVGVFEAPSGREVVIPGFWMQPYEDLCESPCLAENLQAVGEPQWLVRFTPNEVGRWLYSLQIRDDRTIVDTQEGEFSVIDSERPGFIRSTTNRYFRHDDGTPYFPIGHNLDWSGEEWGGVHAYERWFEALSASGGNYARIIIDTPWFIGLEWDQAGDYTTAQDEAARLDMLLQMAETYGISVQLVLLWHQSVDTYNGAPVLVPESPSRPDSSADWDNHAYNTANGGSLSEAAAFFFDTNAQALFRSRLRYIVARWGYSPQIFAWELIDEIDNTGNDNPDAERTWLQDHVSYLRQIDPYGHLITAGSEGFNEMLAGNALLDFTQARFFQRLPIEATGSHEASVINLLRRYLTTNTKPTLLTSHSLNPWFEPASDDPDGIHVQTSLWAAALSGSAGGAASAWGQTYIAPLGLEGLYAPLAAFVSGVDWPTLNLLPAEASLTSLDEGIYEPLQLNQFDRQFLAVPTETTVYTITSDGVFPPLETASSYLYGQLYNNRGNHSQRYQVTMPVDSHLRISISAVSRQSGARLVVSLDNEVIAEMSLSAGTRGVSLHVPLSRGEHTIILTNVGDDWLEIESLVIDDFIAPARVLTLRDTQQGVALAWLHHRGYTWDEAGTAREALLFQYRLYQMPPGRYLTQIWNPLSGAVLGEETVYVDESGVLSVNLLPLDSELALRAFRQPDL